MLRVVGPDRLGRARSEELQEDEREASGESERKREQRVAQHDRCDQAQDSVDVKKKV